MLDHISTQRMEAFCARTLSKEEFVVAAGHLSDCEICLDTFCEVSRSRRNCAPVVLDLSLEEWFKDDHLMDEGLNLYVNGVLDEDDLEIAEAHLRTCPVCREDVRNFRAARERNEAVPIEKSDYDPIREQWSIWNWLPIDRNPVFVIAFTVIAGTAFLALVLFRRGEIDIGWLRRPSSTSALSSRQTVSGSTSLSSESPVPVRTLTPVTTPSPLNDYIASLDDSGKIPAVKSRQMVRLDRIPGRLQQSIKEVLRIGGINRPTDLSDLDSAPGTLRGDESGNDNLHFKLLSPVRTVLAETRPLLQWKPLKGAKSYKVFISNHQGGNAVESESLPPNTTTWKPSSPLERGEIYSWVVVATIDEKEVKSPNIKGAEAKFKVLDDRKLRELATMKKNPQSHLALGVFYAEAGMVAEAEREFQFLAKKNPRSQIAAKLLRTVQSWK